MIFGFWKKKRLRSRQPRPATSGSSARFGGMQEREIQTRFELLVDTVLNRRRSVIEPARALAEFSLVEQERYIAGVDRISLTDPELAFFFCQRAIPALAELDYGAWEPWIDSLLETFGDSGLDASVARIEAFRGFQEARAPHSGSVAFAEIARVLESFIRAINGHTLKLATSEQSYTDTETLFLPARISRFPTRNENFRLYKALLVHQWAQTRFGTWRVDLVASLERFPDPDRALRLFHCLETLRLDACLARELPGLAREMAMLRPAGQTIPPPWQNARRELQARDADVQSSLACLIRLYPLGQEPDAVLYQGQLRAKQTCAIIAGRNRREHDTLQTAPTDPHDTTSRRLPGSAATADAERPAVETEPPGGHEEPAHSQNRPEYDSHAVEIDPGLQIPPETEGTGRLADQPDPDENLEESGTRAPHDFIYDEWDHARQCYRRNWCLMHEQSVQPVPGAFVDETLKKHRGLLKQLRRTFEALNREQRPMKREPFGDDIDIDAVVESWADTRSGLEANERLLLQTRRQDRDIAVMLLIDMSASTAGWINRVERESLVLLCEALELSRDRYAIYGFSGRGNKHCRSFHIKRFDEQYSAEVRQRIEGIRPQDRTRLGAAIRHLGTRLSQVEARTRLLITLSDGRPDDIDGYRGSYGIEDTRKALIEMRHMRIHPYCITIDTDARDYVPHMYGQTSYTVIDQVDKLPARIADIYRKLTA